MTITTSHTYIPQKTRRFMPLASPKTYFTMGCSVLGRGALTTKFSKAWGDSGWSPTRWIHWCLAHSTFFAEKWRNIFQFSSIPTEYRHGPYKRRLKNCFKGWSLVRPSMSLRHMHHCMSMNALEQGLLGLEAAKASDIDDFV